jgi:hypothetical protein
MKKERVYIGKGFPHQLVFRDRYYYFTPIKNVRKFWCKCEEDCKCKDWKFYAERSKK